MEQNIFSHKNNTFASNKLGLLEIRQNKHILETINSNTTHTQKKRGVPNFQSHSPQNGSFPHLVSSGHPLYKSFVKFSSRYLHALSYDALTGVRTSPKISAEPENCPVVFLSLLTLSHAWPPVAEHCSSMKETKIPVLVCQHHKSLCYRISQ